MRGIVFVCGFLICCCSCNKSEPPKKNLPLAPAAQAPVPAAPSTGESIADLKKNGYLVEATASIGFVFASFKAAFYDLPEAEQIRICQVILAELNKPDPQKPPKSMYVYVKLLRPIEGKDESRIVSNYDDIIKKLIPDKSQGNYENYQLEQRRAKPIPRP